MAKNARVLKNHTIKDQRRAAMTYRKTTSSKKVYCWTVLGVSEGEARSLKAAKEAIAAVRERVGHLKAIVTAPNWKTTEVK